MPATAPNPALATAGRRRSRTAKLAALGALALVGTVLLPAGTSGAATATGLGTAESFAVLGAPTVTNTGPTVVNGDLGVSPGLAVTGFGPGIVNGAIHAGNATAAAAKAGAATAYDALAAQGCDVDLTGQDLGLLAPLTPGVYCFSSSAQLTGALTLNALGNPAAVFIFRVGTALTTASNSSVVFTNSFASCNVFWQVGSAATLGTNTAFVGTLIAQTEAITANTGATVIGRLLALNAAVTLDSNVITASPCAPVVVTPVDDTPVDDTPVDETPFVDVPVDLTPVAVTPVAVTPVDDAPVDDTPSSDTTDESTGEPSGPAVPSVTDGPNGPRPPLPNTGSNLMLGGFGVLAITVGGGLILLSDTKRTAAVLRSSSGPSAPRP